MLPLKGLSQLVIS